MLEMLTMAKILNMLAVLRRCHRPVPLDGILRKHPVKLHAMALGKGRGVKRSVHQLVELKGVFDPGVNVDKPLV